MSPCRQDGKKLQFWRCSALSCQESFSVVVTVHGGRKDSGPFNYDTSMGEPLLPVFRQLSDEVPVGYETQELVGSLPEQGVAEFAFFTYGDANSRCVAIAVTRLQPNRLFVDLDRNRHFDAGEEIHRTAGDSADHWQLDLDAEFVVGSNQFEHAKTPCGNPSQSDYRQTRVRDARVHAWQRRTREPNGGSAPHRL